jgi:hypothetical protein
MSALDEKSSLIGFHRANHEREKKFASGQLDALKNERQFSTKNNFKLGRSLFH